LGKAASRRQFLTVALGASAGFVCGTTLGEVEPQRQAAEQNQALIAITLDLEMSRNSRPGTIPTGITRKATSTKKRRSTPLKLAGA